MHAPFYIFTFIFVVLMTALSKAQDSLNSPCEQWNYFGKGICVLIYNCPNPRGSQICGFSGSVPLVCCNVRDTTHTKSLIPIKSQPPVFVNESYTEGIIQQQEQQQQRQQRQQKQEQEQRPKQQRPAPVTVNIKDDNLGARISQIKCTEYAKHVTRNVTIMFLTPQENLVSHSLPKCEYNNLPLIVGGEPVQLGEFPHMVAIGYGSKPSYNFSCGGSLISERFVMTAAHCTRSAEFGSPVIVRLGEHDLQSDDDGADPINVDIAKIISHPEYRPPQKYNDIALLRLATDVQFSTSIRPACLPLASPSPTNTKAVATGWGKIQYSEATSPVLLKVVIPVVNGTTCSNLWASYIKISTLSLPRGIEEDTMLCAGDVTNGGKDTCFGDSGGPLSIASRENQCLHYIIGVTSFGKYCGFKSSPAIYTRVSNYVPWIESVVWPQRG